jgi:hypothetical protein
MNTLYTARYFITAFSLSDDLDSLAIPLRMLALLTNEALFLTAFAYVLRCKNVDDQTRQFSCAHVLGSRARA